MDPQLLIGFLLTLAPITELRAGLPLIVDYCLKNGISVWPYFLLVLILNIFVIFLVFLFLDFVHELLMRWGFYRRVIEKVLKRVQKKVDKIEGSNFVFVALMLLVAVPLPGTGAWTGTLVAWMAGLNRWKSFLAISAGVIIAGVLILFASLGLLGWFY